VVLESTEASIVSRLMVAALLAALTTQPAVADQMGFAARYSSEAKMRRAAAVHGVSVPDGIEVCASAHHPLGSIITVRSVRRGTSWRCVVVDIPHPRDRASIIRRGIIVELTPRGAMHICGSVNEPPRQCPVEVL